MRKAFYGIVGASALAMASAASAAITVGSVTPGTVPYAGPAPTYTFDPGSRPGNNGGNFVTGDIGSTTSAQPLGTHAGTGLYGGLGYYYVAGPDEGNPGTLDLTSFGDIGSISFVWGSMDDYNTLDFCQDALCTTILASFTGLAVDPTAAHSRIDPAQNPLVTFLLDGTDVSNFNYLRLSSSQNAFEIDNLAINPVPEPATWALMLVGFAGIGMTLRRRRQTALAQIA